MVKLRYGTMNQVSFTDLNEYYYVLGFLANSNNAEIKWENNEEQGAWGSEGRIHCLVPESRFPQCFKFTAGRGAVYARINCNEYVGTLVIDHHFKANCKRQDLSAIMSTVPDQYVSSFQDGYGGKILINASNNKKIPHSTIVQPTKKVENKSVFSKPLKKGQIVIHKAFGEGTVVACGEYIKVDFGRLGVKTFAYPGAFEQGYLRLK